MKGSKKNSGQIKTSLSSHLSMRTRRAVAGYLFILPFIIGFLAFSISPLLMSLEMSFSDVTLQTGGPDIDSHLGYGASVKISKNIELPENLRYDADEFAKGNFLVEPVDEVLTLRKDFAYGPQVTLSRQIELPKTVWYNPADLANGVYTVEPLKTALELTPESNLGATVTLSRRIDDLPSGLQYSAFAEESGRIAVEQTNTILSLSADESFGQSVTLTSQIDLPEGYIYDEALLAEKQYVVKMADGSDVPVAFAAYLFDNGHTAQLANAYKALKGGATPNLNRSCGYDKALFEQKGDFVLKLSVPVSFAKHLIDTGNYDLFCEMVAAAQGTTVEELGLPEIFTYDAPLWARQSAAKATLSIQVPDEAAVVPNSFAVYLISSGNADLFYETVDPVANSETVCFLYDPIQDQTGKITAINGELPTNVTYVESDFSNSGVINIKLDNPTIPISFAKYIIEKGGFGMFLGTLVDLLALENFHNALFIDAKFPDLLMDEITKMSVHTLAILVVSFVIAILLNQEFKGRAFVRAVFFLPVILSSGVLVNLEAENTLMQGVQDMISEQTPFTVTDTMMDILRLTGLGGDMLQIIFDLIAEVYDIVMASGIQIIIFLSGLQNVPASLYEAADVEGCTKWEAFWKITFPMVSPLLIVNIIYTIIDFFTKMSGDLNTLLKEMQNDLLYAQMSAMMWIYFLVALALIGVSALIVSKVVATDE